MATRAPSACADLDRKLAHVLERRMRLTLVRERLLGDTPEAACRWIAEALDRTPADRAASDPLRDAILEVLAADAPEARAARGVEPIPGPIPYAFRRDLYAAATAAGATRLAALLRTHQNTGVEATGKRLPPDVAEIPLGVRRSLAKGADALLLEKLALDPDPIVIANLLRNPRLREADVVRIAALRPVPGSTLQEVAGAERWARRTPVRVALARNPHCPIALAAKLVAGLPLTALREMRGDPDLAPETRHHLEAELERRRAPA